MADLRTMAMQVGLAPEQVDETDPQEDAVTTQSNSLRALASNVGLTGDAPKTVGSDIEQPLEERIRAQVEPDRTMFGGDPTSVPNVLGEMGRDVATGAKKLGGEYLDALGTVAETALDHTKPFGPAKVLAGGVESGVRFAAGAASWLASKSASEIVNVLDHAAKYDPKLREQYDLSPEGIAKHRAGWEEAIGGFLPRFLGEPKTEVGKAGTKVIEDVFEFGLAPIAVAEKFYADHGYPNVGKSLAFAGELAFFKTLHAGTGKIKSSLGKMQTKLSEGKISEIDPELKAINEAIQKTVEVEKAVLSAANAEHRYFTKNEHMRKLQEIKQTDLPPKAKKKALKEEQKKFDGWLKEGEKRLEEMRKDKELAKKAERDGKTLEQLIAERLEANQRVIAHQWPEIYEKAKAEVESGKPLLVENIPGERQVWQLPTPKKEVPGKSYELGPRPKEQVERVSDPVKTAEEALLQRPELGEQPQSGLDPLTRAQEPMEQASIRSVPEETIPRAEYQIGPDGKPVQTMRASEGKTYQVGADGKPQLVESVPNRRQVWQVLQSPLSNQRGSVDIGGFIELFGKAPKGLGLLNQLIKRGLSKTDLELSGLAGYLREQGMKRVSPKEIERLAKESGPGVERVVLQGNSAQYSPEGKPAYGNYTLKGYKPGTYKEVLYKYEPAEGSFSEPHFGNAGKNVMAHSRTHERSVIVDDKGKETLHADEIQSKWHDMGSQEGYVRRTIPAFDEIINEIDSKYGIEVTDLKEFESAIKRIAILGDVEQAAAYKKILVDLKKHEHIYNERGDEYFGLQLGVPDAPFKKTWHKMIGRDLVSEAVAKDLDGISWSTSDIMKARYGEGMKTDYASLYDKKMVKFFQDEFGVKARKVRTLNGDNNILVKLLLDSSKNEKYNVKERDYYKKRTQEFLAKSSPEVWYVPVTDKMKKLYSEPVEVGNLTLTDGIPPQQSIFEIMLEPLRNQRGQLNLDFSQKKFREKVSPENRALLLNIGKMAESSGKSVADVLRESGMKPEKVEALSKLYEKAKIERPFAGGLEKAKAPRDVPVEDFDIYELKPGERQVNVGKENNKNIKVDSDTLEMLRNLKRDTSADVAQSFKTPWNFFDSVPELKPLHYMARDRKLSYHRDRVIVVKAVKELAKVVRSTKLREDVGAWHMSLSESGRKAVAATGQKIPASKPKHYDALMPKIHEITKDLYDRLNADRVKRGQSKLPYTEDYFAFFLKENMIDSFQRMFVKDPTHTGISIALDSGQAIEGRHAILEETVFPHLRRGIVPKGIKLELDPLKMVLRYSDTALRHLHYSDLVGFVREIAGKTLRDPETKTTYDMRNMNPKVASYLGSWVNKLAGMDNVNVPRSVGKFMSTLSNNLTAAILLAAPRTMLVQLTAAINTNMVYGLPRTVQGIFETVLGKNEPLLKLSTELETRLMDANMIDPTKSVAGGKYSRAQALVRAGGAAGIKFVDGVMFEATLRTAINHLKPEMEAGKISARELMRQADDMAVRISASGAVEELSPFQRNVLGKTVGLWQTFTINQMNFMTNEMLGFGRSKKLSAGEKVYRTMKLAAGIAAVNYLFEDVGGMPAPFPRPIKTIVEGLTRRDAQGNPDPDPAVLIALNTMLELAQFAPVVGGLKYGTSITGAVSDHMQKITDVISGSDIATKNMLKKALQGDKKAAFEIGTLLAKVFGVTGSGTATKYARGRIKGEGRLRSLMGRVWGDEKEQSDYKKLVNKRQKEDLGIWNMFKPKKRGTKKSSGRTSRTKRSGRSGRSSRR